MKKEEKIFTNNTTVLVGEGKEVPCLLFVTMEKYDTGIKITVKGKRNPLPFTTAVIYEGSVFLTKWLYEKGWIEIGRNYFSN